MDLSAFRSAFPALERYAWLDSGTVPPAARPVAVAVRAVLAAWEEGEFSWRVWEADAEATRGLYGRMVGAPAESVALVSSLSEAAATVAGSLPPGRIVAGEREFRSNLFPWLALRERGFEVVTVPQPGGVLRPESLVAAIDGRTVLVAVSAVQSSNGWRVPLAEVAAACRASGARLFLNLTQMLGALRFDVAEVEPDFVAAHGYKWLLGPRGAAWLYVRPDRLEELRPLAPSWRTAADGPYDAYYGGPYELAADARRADASLGWFSWTGARAALELLLSLDRAEAEARCLQLAAAFRKGAADRGFEVVPVGEPSQIVGVSVPDARALAARLADRHVRAAVRDGFLRAGFHAFNDEGDLAAALGALGAP